MLEPQPRRLSVRDALTTVRVKGDQLSTGSGPTDVRVYNGREITLLLTTPPFTPNVEVRRSLFRDELKVRGSVLGAAVSQTRESDEPEVDTTMSRARVIVEGTAQVAKVSGHTELRVAAVGTNGDASKGGKLIVNTNAEDISAYEDGEVDIQGVLVNQAFITNGTFHAHEVTGNVSLDGGTVDVDTTAESVTVDRGTAKVKGEVKTGHVTRLEGRLIAGRVRLKRGVVDNIHETEL